MLKKQKRIVGAFQWRAVFVWYTTENPERESGLKTLFEDS